ncbi:MAG: carboxy terminal-processing peptidase [Gammaproteobacteria bacterium]
MLIHKSTSGPRAGRKTIRAAQLLFAAAMLLLVAYPGAGTDSVDSVVAENTNAVPAVLESTQRHRQVARMVTRFVERAHYSRIAVDDELSGLVLDNYIESLDPNKHYFRAPDITYFERYRFALDDVMRTGNFDPILDIFRLYRLRAQQNIELAITTLDSEPDFTTEDIYVFNRKDEPWIDSAEEMQDIWRKRVTNDALSLILAEKSWEDASDVLRKRYERVLKRINQLDSDDVFEMFLNSFARTLDPHSSYLSPRQSEEYRIQMSLSYQGIGASLQLEDELVSVLNVIPGGPAAIDGRIQANDRITAVGQEDGGEMVDVVGWQLDDVVQLIRGPSGTTVRLQILPADALPGGEHRVIELVRDKIKLEEQAAKSEKIELERPDGGSSSIGVISIPSFYQDYEARSRGDKDYVSTTRDVRRLIGELEDDGIDGLVIDLRGNGGGHLSEATSLTGLFIPEGPVVQLKDTNGRIEVLDDPVPQVAYGGPLVLLVDRFSASASEIFAAAIQDYRRGIVIGQRTFGKGTVQNLYILDQYARRVPDPGLGQLTLTIGKYYRVTGGSTQHRGVLPDIDLPSVVDPERIGESSRDRALPWDQIKPTGFRAEEPLDSEIAYLTQYQNSRMVDDPDINYLKLDIAAADEARTKTFVSLNMDARIAEREARQADRLMRENERRVAAGLEPVESLEDLDVGEQPDILLDQATRIIVDLVSIEGARSAAVTEVVVPGS